MTHPPRQPGPAGIRDPPRPHNDAVAALRVNLDRAAWDRLRAARLVTGYTTRNLLEELLHPDAIRDAVHRLQARGTPRTHAPFRCLDLDQALERSGLLDAPRPGHRTKGDSP